MKKLIKLLSMLFLISIIFIGCNSSNENNAKKVAEEFVRNLYTVDSKKVADYNALSNIGTLQSLEKTIQTLDKAIQPLMTEKGYKKLVANRDDIFNVQGCAINNYTMQVTEFDFTNSFYDSKQNIAEYYYEAKLKLISSNDKNEQTDVGKGYVELVKENGQWKVSTYKMTTAPKLLIKSK